VPVNNKSKMAKACPINLYAGYFCTHAINYAYYVQAIVAGAKLWHGTFYVLYRTVIVSLKIK